MEVAQSEKRYVTRPFTRNTNRPRPTYADVAGRPNRGQNFARSRAKQDSFPPDPHFGKVLRTTYKLIRMVRHLHNVSIEENPNAQPPTIKRLVEHLTGIIKPAIPSQHTRTLLEGNAKNWGYNTQLILEEHYQSGIDQILTELTSLIKEDWHLAFEVAKRWADRNIGHRLKQDTLKHTEALIVSVVQTSPNPSVQDNVSTQVIEISTQTSPRMTPTRNDNMFTEEDFPHLPSPEGTPPTSPVCAAPPQPLLPREQRAGKRRNPCVIEESSLQSLLDLEFTTPTPINNQVPRVIIQTTGDHNKQTNTSERIVVIHDHRPSLIPSQTEMDFGLGPVTPRTDTPIQSIMERIPPPDPIPNTRELPHTVQSTLILPTPSLQVGGDGGTPSPTPMSRPTRHISTNRKMVDWSLCVWKKWLIMGDSNLARIPDFQIPNLPIESYPGARRGNNHQGNGDHNSGEGSR